MSGARASQKSGEERLIERHFAPIAWHPGALGLTDDAAFVAPPAGCDLVLKTDAIVSSIHFFFDDPADLVARKALRVNLSDLAAKGAKPLGFLLSLAIPTDLPPEWLTEFSRGLAADAEEFDCPLFGGDTDRSPGPIMVSIAAFGSAPSGTMVKRRGARPGDIVAVTGTIGDAALALALRDGRASAAWRPTPDEAEHLRRRYLLPQPRNAIAEAVRTHASAAMDVSDGLAGDLAKLCRASGVSAEIAIEKVPLSPAAASAVAAAPDLFTTILTGGDDYEILLTLSPDRLESFRAAASACGVAVEPIGRIVEGEGLPTFTDPSGATRSFADGSFSHFQDMR
ncbi:MAG: thiamine-phosphate kinase [Alphaproteobacteria bacterium]